MTTGGVWANVYNTSGTKVAQINDFIGGSAELRVDEIGRWSLTVPASHAHADDLSMLATVKFYANFGRATSPIYLGGGLVEQRERRSNGDEIKVGGRGMMQELAHVVLMDAAVRAKITTPTIYTAWPGDAALDSGIEYNQYSGGYTSVTIVPGDTSHDGIAALSAGTGADDREYLYIGYWTPFDRITFDFRLTNSTAATITAQYLQWTPNTDGFMGWATVSITDGTASGGAPFATNGTISFAMPSDWGPIIHGNRERYWIRIYTDTTLDHFAMNDVTLRAWGQSTSDLSGLFTGYAPGAWALSGGGYSGTANGTYFERLHGVTLFSVLHTIAERTGEHFRYEDADKVLWKRADVTDSGLVAATFGNPSHLTSGVARLVVLSVEVDADARDYITRLYCEGAGEGGAAITLAQATDSAPSGYAYSTSNSYVNISPEPTPNIHAYMKFADITSMTGRSTEAVANELLAAALAELQRRSDSGFAAYRLTVAGIRDEIPVGEWMRVIWRGHTSAGIYVDINESLYIHTVQYEFGPEGVTAQVGVATSDNHPVTDYDWLRNRLNRQAFSSNVVQPANFEQKAAAFGWLDFRDGA